jgi:hypothetical protein
MARRLDVVRGELTGDSMTLADVVGYDVGFKLGAFSLSADGHVLKSCSPPREQVMPGCT